MYDENRCMSTHIPQNCKFDVRVLILIIFSKQLLVSQKNDGISKNNVKYFLSLHVRKISIRILISNGFSS